MPYARQTGSSWNNTPPSLTAAPESIKFTATLTSGSGSTASQDPLPRIQSDASSYRSTLITSLIEFLIGCKALVLITGVHITFKSRWISSLSLANRKLDGATCTVGHALRPHCHCGLHAKAALKRTVGYSPFQLRVRTGISTYLTSLFRHETIGKRVIRDSLFVDTECYHLGKNIVNETVPQRSTQFVECHRWIVLFNTPKLRYVLGLTWNNPEHTLGLVLPADVFRVARRILQHSAHEFPEVRSSRF